MVRYGLGPSLIEAAYSTELLHDVGIRNQYGADKAFAGHRLEERESETHGQGCEEKYWDGPDAECA